MPATAPLWCTHSALAVLVFAVQVAFSRWWLATHRVAG
jgi:hypothetical protein